MEGKMANNESRHKKEQQNQFLKPSFRKMAVMCRKWISAPERNGEGSFIVSCEKGIPKTSSCPKTKDSDQQGQSSGYPDNPPMVACHPKRL
jgi:hypothetical protein